MTNKSHLDLMARLREDLSDYRYTEFQVSELPGIGQLHQIMTPRRWLARYVCVVLEVTESIHDRLQCKGLLEQIRSFLSQQYARFPWWKEIGMFSVLLCSHQLYEQVKDAGAEFKDSSGLHVTVMLGTVFVDRDQFQSSAVETWGLWYSGQHFVDIKRAVREWCKQNRDV